MPYDTPHAFFLPATLAPSLRITPLPPAFLARVRGGSDDQGQIVECHVARGGEPLRDCLRAALPGEPILLASYCPFTLAGPYREYGPIFVAAEEQGAAPGRLTLEDEQPYLGATFVLRAYSREERIVDACMSGLHRAAGDLARLFARADVAFVLVRYAAYGCYAAGRARLS